MNDIAQLDQAIRAVCPIDGVSGSESPTIQFRPEATDEQRAAAQAVLAGWDRSPKAAAEREAARRKQEVIDGLQSPEAQAKAFRAFAFIVNGEMNKLRAALGLPTRTFAEATAAFRAVVESGAIE